MSMSREKTTALCAGSQAVALSVFHGRWGTLTTASPFTALVAGLLLLVRIGAVERVWRLRCHICQDCS